MALFKPLESNRKDEKSNGGKQETEHVRCLIVGSGPAGYTAAIYAARANLHPVLYTGMQPGGQLTTTTDVENFPGYPEGVKGDKMMEDFKQQAGRFGTDVRWGLATGADLSVRPFKIEVDEKKVITADALIISTGAAARYLGLPSEKAFMGHGVSACATCDGFFYKEQDVAVVGGGDSAAEEALYLSGLCRKVYIIHRRDKLRASRIMQKRVQETGNIRIIWDHVVREVTGKVSVEGVVLENVKTRKEKKLDIQGFFLAIGHKPNSGIFAACLDTDKQGYIITEKGSTRTNIKGVFACGDVQDPVYKQAVTAAGSGCMAALDAEKFLGEYKSVGMLEVQ